MMPDPLNGTRFALGLNGCTEASASEPIPDSERQFRTLALAALDNQQSERGKLARMLHDDVAQILSGAGLQLDILKMDLEDRVPEIGSYTVEIQELLEHVVKRIRELSYELNPDIVERAGLRPAFDLLVGRFRKVFPGAMRLIYDSSLRVPVAAGVAMEKIAEEAVANAIRHAHCNQIEIVVKSIREGAALQVSDDGIGFDCELARRSPRGLGLLMMDYCATKAGLRLTVTSNAGSGATVRAGAAYRMEDSRKQDRQYPG